MPDAVGHVPRRAVGAKFKLALELQGADALLRRANEMKRHDPLPKRYVAVLEDRSYRHAELIGLLPGILPARMATVKASPTTGNAEDISTPTPRAFNAGRPADRLKRGAGILIGHLSDLLERHAVHVSHVGSFLTVPA